MESNEPITNESKTISISDLKSFTIRGLFGYKDIVLPLDKEVLILIAENGAGKTEILNILYQFLTKNLPQLFLVDEEYKQGSIQSEYVKSLSLEFKNNTNVEILFKDKDIYLDYLRQQQYIQEGDFILFDQLYNHDKKLLFCFFEGQDDMDYYSSRIRDYARCEFQEFYFRQLI